jgi:flagellar L-ring protein precursor FlgH
MRAVLLMLVAITLSACVHPREIGREPDLSPVGAQLSSEQMMAKPVMYPRRPAFNKYSTWNDRAANLFTANRAVSRGDILTVKIAINDSAKVDNQTDRSRTSTKSLGLGGSFSSGSAGAAGDFNVSGDIDSGTDFAGSGGTQRAETIDLSIAVVVVEELANGNLLVQGSQEVRVNAELRILTLSGIVRPSDIGPENTVPYDRIAEARISYGGKGRISEVQQPPYGQQALDLYLPF